MSIPNNDDYYGLLEIDKKASDKEIEKAYKKAALKWHPDRNLDNVEHATGMFKCISEAYDVLRDPEKRAIYDQVGAKGLKERMQNGGGNTAGMDAQSLFEQMFRGGGHPFGNMFGMNVNVQNQNRGPQKGQTVTFDLTTTLRELYLGCSKKLKLNRDIICERCHGCGLKGSSIIHETKCSDCNGQGMKVEIRQLGPGFISQQHVQCNKCKGSGEYIPDSDKCDDCHGNKIKKGETILDVVIPKGTKDGTQIKFEKQSDEYPGRIPGDLIVIIKERNPSDGFKRTPDGESLIYKKDITLQEALCGYEFIIDHLDGRKLHISNNVDVIKPNEKRRIAGEGMPILRGGVDTNTRGDLFIEFNVIFPEPTHITNKGKAKLKEVLPGPTSGVVLKNGTHASYTPTK